MVILQSNIKKDWQRARTPDKRAQRRKQILDVAFRLFRDMEYENVSLNAISRAAKLSKTSVYLYFKTREEILMEIFFESLRQWADNSATELKKLPDGATSGDLAETLTDVFWADKRFGAIAPLVSVSLEHNVSDDVLAACFRIKTDAADRLREALARFIELNQKQSLELLIHALSLYAQYITYQNNEGMTRVLHNTEFEWMQCDYRAMVSRMLALWIEDEQRKTMK